MTFEEVRDILKEYYIEKEMIFPNRIYKYTEPGAYNSAFILYEEYAWGLLEASKVEVYGEHIKFSKESQHIEDEVYDSPEELRNHIFKMKNSTMIAKSKLKIRQIEKEFK